MKEKLEIVKKSKRNQDDSKVRKEPSKLHCGPYRLENHTEFMRNQIYN